MKAAERLWTNRAMENAAIIAAGVFTHKDFIASSQEFSEAFEGQVGIIAEVVKAAKCFTAIEDDTHCDWYSATDEFVDAIVLAWHSTNCPDYGAFAKVAIANNPE